MQRGEAATEMERGHSCPQRSPVRIKVPEPSTALIACHIAADRNVRPPLQRCRTTGPAEAGIPYALPISARHLTESAGTILMLSTPMRLSGRSGGWVLVV